MERRAASTSAQHSGGAQPGAAVILGCGWPQGQSGPGSENRLSQEAGGSGGMRSQRATQAEKPGDQARWGLGETPKQPGFRVSHMAQTHPVPIPGFIWREVQGQLIPAGHFSDGE